VHQFPSEVRRIFGKDHQLDMETIGRMADIICLKSEFNEFGYYGKLHAQELDENEKLNIFFHVYMCMRTAEDVVLGASSKSDGAKKLKDMLISGMANKENSKTDWLYQKVWPHINYSPFRKVYTSQEMRLAYQQRCEQK
jgi:hypothetical protein